MVQGFQVIEIIVDIEYCLQVSQGYLKLYEAMDIVFFIEQLLIPVHLTYN